MENVDKHKLEATDRSCRPLRRMSQRGGAAPCVAYCAASIAGADAWKTGWEASLTGIMGYIIPFVFIYNNAIIMQGPVFVIIATAMLLFIAVTFSASVVTGYFFKHISIALRILLAMAAAAIVILACQKSLLANFTPAMIVIVVGSAFLLAFYLLNRKLVKSFTAEHAQV